MARMKVNLKHALPSIGTLELRSTGYSKCFGTTVEDPEASETFCRARRNNPPEVMAGAALGRVSRSTGDIRGALKAKFIRFLGNSTQRDPADPATGFGRLPPAQLATRIALIEQYTDAAHSLGKIKRIMPYIDFGTQLFGRHDRLSMPLRARGDSGSSMTTGKSMQSPLVNLGLAPSRLTRRLGSRSGMTRTQSNTAWNSPLSTHSRRADRAKLYSVRVPIKTPMVRTDSYLIVIQHALTQKAGRSGGSK